MIRDKLTGKLPAVSGDIPEAVSFDGKTDYLSRDTDLVDNTDSKTFTFSCWVYSTDTRRKQLYSASEVGDHNTELYFYIDNTGNEFRALYRNSAGDVVLDIKSSLTAIPKNTWVHILLSLNTINSISKLYINDREQTDLVSNKIPADTFLTFSHTQHGVLANAYNAGVTAYAGKCRLSNLFLDYTYRDLSIEANRRLFITSDGKPA